MGFDLIKGFDHAATSYDRLVGAGPGYHESLRRSARRLGLPDDGAGLRLLDLGCGTGASTAALLSVYPRAEIVAVDASEGMLRQARQKPWPRSVSFLCARAEQLVTTGRPRSFDGALAAYVIRNVPSPGSLLADLGTMLKPDAPFAVHEFALDGSRLARTVWTALCWAVVIPGGWFLDKDASLYRYLWRSVLEFDDAGTLARRMRDAGLLDVEVLPAAGWQRGLAHTFLARRPPDGTGRHRVVHQPAQRSDRRPGRDQRAVRLAPRAGQPSSVGGQHDKPRVAVVGGGIAGLAAAVTLVERGVQVELFERQSYLGGRVGGWPTTLRDGSEVTMSRGFHAFFRQYYNLRALLRRAGPDNGTLTPLPDYPLLHADGHRDGFAGLSRTPPWNALGFVARSPTFRWRDLPRTKPRAALGLLDVSVPAVYRDLDHIDASSYLERIGFPPRARELAFSVFSRSFFADPTMLSAAELATMFHLYFLGSSEGLPFDVPSRPFPDALWNPLADYLSAANAVVRSNTTVRRIETRNRRNDDRAEHHRYTIHTDHLSPIAVDAVVLAGDVHGLRELVGASPRLGDAAWRNRIDALRTAPSFAVSRLWLDGAVRGDRPGFLGTAGFDLLDNVSVLQRYEDEAARWAHRTNGSVLELHSYALPSDLQPTDLRARMLRELHRVYPETAGMSIVDERHVIRNDCPLFAAGTFEGRPTVRTPDPFVVLAGDLVRVDLPVALMERAATSGMLAADALLERWGLPGAALWSVPNHGRFRRWLPFGRTQPQNLTTVKR